MRDSLGRNATHSTMCTRSRDLILLVSLILAPRLAQAQDSVARVCWDTAITQTTLTRCADLDLRTSRLRLQRLLRELRDSLDSAALPGLDSVQRRWEAYSEAQCRWESEPYDGGTMRPMLESGCLAMLTEERIDQLKAFLCGWDNHEPRCAAAKRYDLQPPDHRE